MRLYSMINMYLSPIQHGIQTAHVQNEMHLKAHFDIDPKPLQTYLEWAKNHKTIIVCNGGNAASLLDFIGLFSDPQNPYLFSWFNEDEDSLNGALTCVGILLPEEIYGVTAEFVFDNKTRERVKIYKYIKYDEVVAVYNNPNDYMYQLIDAVKSARLA